jgi:hypothetical protein
MNYKDKRAGKGEYEKEMEERKRLKNEYLECSWNYCFIL